MIAERSAALNRMLSANAGLTGLPAPVMENVEIDAWIRRVTALETRLGVEILAGPELSIHGDRDQLDQLLINLLRNAVDASLQTGGAVQVGWQKDRDTLRLWVEDQGPGLPKTDHLFVPFFTTKQNGTGIGLVVSRQIAEVHGGALHLENNADGKGCKAILELPL